MKTIFIPQIPESITDITTNSSSEIFVIGKDKEIELVDGLIDEKKWRWWFGEKKRFNNVDDVKHLMKQYPHAIESLFGLTGIPDDNPHSRCYISDSGELVEEPSRMSPALRALKNANEKIAQDFFRNRGKRGDPSWDEAHKKYMDSYDAERDFLNQEIDEWMNTQNLEQFVGAFYYECGEDNELSDWEEVHNTIPGNFCRLS